MAMADAKEAEYHSTKKEGHQAGLTAEQTNAPHPCCSRKWIVEIRTTLSF